LVKFILLIVVALLISCAETEKSFQPNVRVAPLPLLHIQPEVYDLGDIQEGETAVVTFLIRNNHQEMIDLVDIQASCGCTVAEPDSYVIMPGGFTQLRVAVDTTAKQLGITKQVYVTDSLGHKASAMLTFNVVSNPHGVATTQVKGIFDGQCASCHYEPLLDKHIASNLYGVGCAMCHGEDASGAYAPSLRGFSSLTTLKSIIAEGVGKPQMPGFAKSQGGPLREEQIHALAVWLMGLSQKQK